MVSPKLYAHQQECLQRMISILDSNYFCINTAKTGSGKSVVACELALKKKLSVICVCPVAAMSNWETETDKYDVPIFMDEDDNFLCMSYKKFSGVNRDQPDHPLLIKTETGYAATDYLIDILRMGCLIIFDEAQNLTGDSQQSMACQALMITLRELYNKEECHSRALFLSATMIDNINQVSQFFKNVGVVTDYRLDTQQIVSFCYDLGMSMEVAVLWNLLTSSSPGTSLKKSLWTFYNDVIKDRVSCSMGDSEVLAQNAIGSTVNLHVKFSSSKDQQAYTNALQEMEDALAICEYKVGKSNFGQIMKIRSTIQLSLCPVVVKMCNNIMKSMYYQNNKRVYPKVVIYITYIESLNAIADQLSKYDPLIISGETPAQQRNEMINLFNEENNDHRLLICTLQTGGVSINLHSKNEKYPRIALALTDYQTKSQQQAAGRFYREGAKGSSMVCFIFGPGDHEQRLISVINRKGCILSEFHSDQPSVFPCDYKNLEVDPDYVPVPEGLMIKG